MRVSYHGGWRYSGIGLNGGQLLRYYAAWPRATAIALPSLT